MSENEKDSKLAAKAAKLVARKADLTTILERLGADEKRIAMKKARIEAELKSLG